MKLLNLGCGGERPQSLEWTNLDDLHSQLAPETVARIALDLETNYVNFVVGSAPLPFDDNSLDGILASHFFEHFDAQQGLKIMQDCRRILVPGGVLLVSVPDASYFRRVYPEDKNSNWPRLFDVRDPRNPIPTFFEAALWFDQHKAILTEDALWSYFTRAGLSPVNITRFTDSFTDSIRIMIQHLNRRIFSLEMAGVKS